MQIDTTHNYKGIIRTRVKQFNKNKMAMTLKKLAQLVPMQYTFLSKIMNDENTHFSRSHLYSIIHYLEFLPHEKDFLLLLRDYEAATHPELKKYLFAKIEAHEKSKQIEAKFDLGENSQLTQKMRYLLDPIAMLTHVFLLVDCYREDPKRIAEELGVPFETIKQAILDLAKIEAIELHEGSLKIKSVLEKRIHYPASHPLMQTGIKLMRSYCATEITKIPENSKKTFFLTYSADKTTQGKIVEKFEKFISEANALVKDARNEQVYQLNMDIFSWKH